MRFYFHRWGDLIKEVLKDEIQGLTYLVFNKEFHFTHSKNYIYINFMYHSYIEMFKSDKILDIEKYIYVKIKEGSSIKV